MEKMVRDRAQRNHKAITVVGTVVPEATLPVRASACRFFFFPCGLFSQLSDVWTLLFLGEHWRCVYSKTLLSELD